MSIQSTQLHGMKTQIDDWLTLIPTMDGYVEEDYNPLAEAEAHLIEVQDQLHYAIQDLREDSE